MFEHGGTAADLAITALERRFYAEIKVDWNRDGQYAHPLSDLSPYVERVLVDRSLKGAAPDELMLVEGASAAELEVQLQGEYNGLSLTSVFSPYHGLSPFFRADLEGCEITYRIGVETSLGTVWYPQFVGFIRTITPDRVGGVAITALDRVELLRKPILFPAWAMSEEHVSYGETQSQLIRSHWVIDHCLRWCDVSPTPYRPNYREETGLPPDSAEGPQFFLTGNGSYVPTLGWLDNPNADSFPADGTEMYAETGPRHPSLPPESPRPLAFNGLGTPIGHEYGDPSQQGIIRYWVADRSSFQIRSTHYFGFTINTNGPNGNAVYSIGLHNALEVRVGAHYEFQIQIQAGNVRARIYDWYGGEVFQVTEWVPIPTGVENVEVFVQWDNSEPTGSRILVQAGSHSNGGLQYYGPPSEYDRETDQIRGRVTVGQALSLSDIWYASRNYYGAGPGPHEGRRPARYAALLDRGLNRLTHIPAKQYPEAWDVITAVAAAEFGSVFWDEEGVFHFWNRDTILSKQANPVRTLSLDEVEGLQITRTLDSVRNVYTVQARRRRARFSGKIYESRDVNEFYVPAFTEKRFRIWMDNVVSPLTFVMQKHTTLTGTGFPSWNDSVGHGYCVQYLIGGVWQERGDYMGVDVDVDFNALGYLNVRIWNGWDVPIRLAHDTNTPGEGVPAFRFAGTIIEDYDSVPEVLRDQTSITKYGARNLTLDGDWYQDSFSATALASSLVSRTSRPTPTTDAITIAGDPRLQLGDTIRIQDPQGLGEQFDVQILGITREYSRDSGLTDTLTVELVRMPSGIWDSAQYGVWDQSLIWS